MIAVIDYGVGNLFSLCRSLEAVGQTPVVTGDPAVLRRADKLFLPGVGAFADAAEKLRRTGLDRVIREEAAQGKPILGICLGMQLLFEESREFGTWQGLGLLPGKVVPMEGLFPRRIKFPTSAGTAFIFPPAGGIPLLAGVEEGTVCILSTPFMRLNVTTWSSPRRNTEPSSPPRWPGAMSWAVSFTRRRVARLG